MRAAVQYITLITLSLLLLASSKTLYIIAHYGGTYGLSHVIGVMILVYIISTC